MPVDGPLKKRTAVRTRRYVQDQRYADLTGSISQPVTEFTYNRKRQSPPPPPPPGARARRVKRPPPGARARRVKRPPPWRACTSCQTPPPPPPSAQTNVRPQTPPPPGAPPVPRRGSGTAPCTWHWAGRAGGAPAEGSPRAGPGGAVPLSRHALGGASARSRWLRPPSLVRRRRRAGVRVLLWCRGGELKQRGRGGGAFGSGSRRVREAGAGGRGARRAECMWGGGVTCCVAAFWSHIFRSSIPQPVDRGTPCHQRSTAAVHAATQL